MTPRGTSWASVPTPGRLAVPAGNDAGEFLRVWTGAAHTHSLRVPRPVLPERPLAPPRGRVFLVAVMPRTYTREQYTNVARGRQLPGRLTERAVRHIRKNPEGLPAWKLALIYGVHVNTVHRVWWRQAWGHVE